MESNFFGGDAKEEPVDWADSPLMDYVEELADLDHRRGEATEDASQEKVKGLYVSACRRIESLWEELSFPEVMRCKFRATHMMQVTSDAYATLLAEITCLLLYRRHTLATLQHVSRREEELSMMMRGVPNMAEIWKLRNLTATCLESIDQWKRIFPWNHRFLYKGQEFQDKSENDLEILMVKINSHSQIEDRFYEEDGHYEDYDERA